MRLLHATNLTFEEFFEAELPRYAILSHRWISRQEVSYEEFIDQRHRLYSDKSGYKKIFWFADLARKKGLEWCWVDTCCIDKRSSAELSEAINSMFKWYRRSSICIAYLFDVETEVNFKQSQWFLRGWTLQELLAPSQMEFYNKDYESIGTKESHLSRIKDITGIRRRYLQEGTEIFKASIAERMSWAAQRSTTRTEDVAYCLLGILQVNMPLLYGEGEQAFVRLQEEIVKRSDDESIFAWTSSLFSVSGISLQCTGMFAESPKAFRHSVGIRFSESQTFTNRNPLLKFHRPPYYQTNKGLEIQVQEQMMPKIHTERRKRQFALMPLNCYTGSNEPSTNGSEMTIFVLIYKFEDDWFRISLPVHIRGSPSLDSKSSEPPESFKTFRITSPRSGLSVSGAFCHSEHSKFIEMDLMTQPLTLSQLLGVKTGVP